jgi:hypothetical protein
MPRYAKVSTIRPRQLYYHCQRHRNLLPIVLQGETHSVMGHNLGPHLLHSFVAQRIKCFSRF